MSKQTKTYWCVLSRYYTEEDKEHLSFHPAKFSDVTGIDFLRIYYTRRDCAEVCKLLNKLKGY